MRRRVISLLLRSVAAATLVSASTAVAALLYLMFTTDETTGRAVGLFGSLYLTSTASGSGAVDVSMGVADPTALVVIFALSFTVIVLAQVIHQALKQYRLDLIAARAGT